MDPNETLRLMRERIEEWNNGEVDHMDEVGEWFEQLDDWISNGGFLPSDWQPKAA